MYSHDFCCTRCNRSITIDSLEPTLSVLPEKCLNCKEIKAVDEMVDRLMAIGKPIQNPSSPDKMSDQEVADRLTMEMLRVMDDIGIFEDGQWSLKDHCLILELNILMGRFMEDRKGE